MTLKQVRQLSIGLPDPLPAWEEGLADTREALFEQGWECIKNWSLQIVPENSRAIAPAIYWNERFRAIGYKLVEVVPVAQRGFNQHGSERDCCADWLDAMAEHFAAPFGQRPEYRGQAARWVLESKLLGCRLLVHWPGMERVLNGHVSAVDWHLPFISLTGFRSMWSFAPVGDPEDGPDDIVEKRLWWELTSNGANALELEMIEKRYRPRDLGGEGKERDPELV